MASTAEWDGPPLCCHHCRRAFSAGGHHSAHHATIKHCHVRRTSVNVSDTHLYSFSSRHRSCGTLAVRRRRHGQNLGLDDSTLGANPLCIRTLTIHSRLGCIPIFGTCAVDSRPRNQLPPCS